MGSGREAACFTCDKALQQQTYRAVGLPRGLVALFLLLFPSRLLLWRWWQWLLLLLCMLHVQVLLLLKCRSIYLLLTVLPLLLVLALLLLHMLLLLLQLKVRGVRKECLIIHHLRIMALMLRHCGQVGWTVLIC